MGLLPKRMIYLLSVVFLKQLIQWELIDEMTYR